MLTVDEIKTAKVAKVKTLKSQLFFTRYFFKSKTGQKFIVNDHHARICETLERIISGELTKVIFNLPPRYGKTELIVKNFIAHCLALNPSAKFLHLSYSDSLALDNSEEIKDLVQSEPYQLLFPEVEIKKDAKAKKKWYTTQGGGVYATSATGQVTGFGAGKVEDEPEEVDEEGNEIEEFINDIDQKKAFGGAIVIDDPIKPEDAESDILRGKCNNRFDSTIRSRANSRNTPIIVVMQRIHEDDLTGYLIDLEPEEWHVVNIPAINEDGTALWPHKHTIEELRHIEKINQYVFDRQYAQNPISRAGKLWPLEDLKRFTMAELRLDDVEARNSYIDVADEGTDFHVCITGMNVGQKVYVTDIVCNQQGINYNLPSCASQLNASRSDYCRVEANNMGGTYANLLEPETTTTVLKITSTTNKHTRIIMEAGFVTEYFYFRSDVEPDSEYAVAVKMITNYMKEKQKNRGKKVDAPDALAGLSAMIRNFLSHLYFS